MFCRHPNFEFHKIPVFRASVTEVEDTMTNSRMITRAVLALAVILIGLASTAGATCDPAQTKQADHAYQIATGFLQSKDWLQAVPQLKTALDLCPEHANSLRWLGKSYLQTKQYDLALVQYKALIDVLGRETTASDYMNFGKVNAKLKKYPAARQAYQRAYRIDGTNCNILYNYGMMNYMVKDYAGAVDILAQAADGCPSIRSNVLDRLAKACEKAASKEERLGNVAKAEEYRALHAQYASDAGGSVGYQLISSRMNSGNYQGAITAAQDFLSKNPEDPKADKVYLNMARSQKQIGQTSAAAASFKGYLNLKPKAGSVAGELIEMLAKAERCDEALAEADAAMLKMRSDVNVRYANGKALECAGRYMDAKEEFRFVVNNGSGDLKKWATDEMRRQDQLEEIRVLKRQNSGR
jgi:tetratricopeptide (TPR) repeat protein